MSDPCLGPSVSNLFIPRKNSLQKRGISRTEEYEDQLANWLAIQNWANSLNVGGSTACVGLVASDDSIPWVSFPDSTYTVIPYDLEIFASNTCAFSNALIIGGHNYTQMCSFKYPGVMHCDAGVGFAPHQASGTTGYVTLQIHIISLGGMDLYDDVIAEQTCLIPADVAVPISLSCSIDGVQTAADSSFYATVYQKSGSSMTLSENVLDQPRNVTYLTAHMVDVNHTQLNPYPSNT